MNSDTKEPPETLGILVNTADHPDYLISLARAARAKGKQVRVHFSGPGVRLLSAKEVSELHDLAPITACAESLARFGGDFGGSGPDGVRVVPAAELGRFISGCRRYVVF